MAIFITEQLGFDVNENQIRYRLPLFGLSLKDIKNNRKNQRLMLDILWSENEPLF